MVTRFAKFASLIFVIIAAFVAANSAGIAGTKAASGAAPSGPIGRYIVVAKGASDYNALQADAQKAGGAILTELAGANAFVMRAQSSVAAALRADSHAQGVAKDGVRRLIEPDGTFAATPTLSRTNVNLATGSVSTQSFTQDPASTLPGLMWNLERIRSPQANNVTPGVPAVIVGVADTGLDFTHPELNLTAADVVDLTASEDPPLCSTYFGVSDADLAGLYGGPPTTDWNGHGSWIGGNIAAVADGVGINGAAPGIALKSLKISQWCGYAYDSSILGAFLYAANNDIDVVSISFGGYLDLTDPEQRLIYQQYVGVVQYAKIRGTVIVAAAGNEHLRIGTGGIVLSHGPLTVPGGTFQDYYGLFETPGGIPGVVMVSATGNVVAGSSASCPAGTTGSAATCKPASDAHQPTGVGKQDQLTYYSNYGPRVDVAAPGGARKFNVPAADRGGTAGWPQTADEGFKAYEDFSITSNWATEIPCYVFSNSGGLFYDGACYSIIQGTSMATPHASAVIALIASKNPPLRHNVGALVAKLKNSARKVSGNTTPGLSATDFSPGDLTGIACPTGYCHLGGAPIPDKEAYGAGIVDALKAVQ
ncbi:MAG: S8 family serine peptidase [Chloroflexi bacterium]|nr:S8 family serine peptidase [Chloroflexota bacterium]